MFKNICVNKKYISEVIRQNPLLLENNNNLKNNYNIIKSKKLFGIKIDNSDNFFNNYLYCFLKSKKRNIYTKGLKLNYTLKYKKLEEDDIINNSEFRKMYNNTMKKVNSIDYYYFNDNYFKNLIYVNNTYITWVEDTDKNKIGFSILFIEDLFIHYHLSCNDQSNNCIIDFMILEIIKVFCKNKIFILGCGIIDGDNLYNFKKSFSNIEFIYNIYKR